MKSVSPQSLNQAHAKEPPIQVIDVLTEQHFQAEHLPNAENACVYEISFIETATKIAPDKDREIALYGLSDQFEAARSAYEKLTEAGWTNVSVLQGGIEAWKDAGVPVLGDGQSLAAPSGEFAGDVDKSGDRWVGRNLVNQHDGSVSLSSAAIELDQGRLFGGKAVVDMESIFCRDIEDSKLAQVLIDHLRTGDFFLIDKFPTASFELQSAESMPNASPGSPNYRVKGTLSLSGRLAKIQFPALLGYNETSIALQAHFDCDRVQWDSKYGSGRIFEALGQHLVNDFISISFRLIAPAQTS